MHYYTGDPKYRRWAWEMFSAIRKHCKAARLAGFGNARRKTPPLSATGLTSQRRGLSSPQAKWGFSSVADVRRNPPSQQDSQASPLASGYDRPLSWPACPL